MKKKIITGSLLLFVGVSLLAAVADVAGWWSASNQNAATNAEQAGPPTVDTESQARFAAIYFHAPHRCPACIKIEAFAHEALSSEIEQGNIVWNVADYTTEENKSIVEQCEVFTSTVVLVDRQNGKIVRWKNLEEVWNHTNDQNAFTAFIDDEWKRFQETSAS